MRTIRYKNKNTSAHTQYRSIDKEDMDFILSSLKGMQDIISACNGHPEQAMRDIYDDMTRGLASLPRRTQPRFATNSVSSFIDGVLENMTAGTQRDLTHKTCDGLDVVFSEFTKITDEFGEIEFIEKSRNPELNKNVVNKPQSTFNDLFEYEMVVTFRKKVDKTS